MPIEWANQETTDIQGGEPTAKSVEQAANDHLRQMVTCNLQDYTNNVHSETSVDGLLATQPITKQERCEAAEESTELHADMQMSARRD